MNHKMSQEIKSIRTLVARLHGPAKGRIMEALSVYRDSLPDDRLRYRTTVDGLQEWPVSRWHKLFHKRANDDDYFIIEWQGGTAWLYRGPVSWSADLFGPKMLGIRDRLKFAYPIWSKFSLDARTALGEN